MSCELSLTPGNALVPKASLKDSRVYKRSMMLEAADTCDSIAVAAF